MEFTLTYQDTVFTANLDPFILIAIIVIPLITEKKTEKVLERTDCAVAIYCTQRSTGIL